VCSCVPGYLYLKETAVLELTKRLTDAFGVSGNEEAIRSVIGEEIAGLVDEMHVDALGNLVTLRRGTGNGESGSQAKRVMLAAHMDEIGAMVTYIDERGYMRFAAVGGLYPAVCLGQQVRFADGTAGAIGLDGRADRNQVPRLSDLFIDVGATSRSEVKQRVGDVAAFRHGFAAQNNAWFAPNMDDRIGCVVLVQLLRELKGEAISHDLYAVFTTQEEVGTRGATTSAYAVNPDIAIALDVTLAGDTPHFSPAMEVYMGRGTAIKVQDGGMIGHVGLNRLLIAAAEAAQVPYQLEVLAGGTTDAYSMQVVRAGVPASAISVPSRHVHQPSQVVDRRDVEASVGVLASFLRRPIDL
jgi:endoglucanase